MNPAVVLTALLPAFTQGLQQLFNRLLGSSQPATVADKIALIKAESDAATALAALDSVNGTPSQWVIDLRSALRPIASLVLVLGFIVVCLWLVVFHVPILAGTAAFVGVLGDLAGCAIFYWFGERFQFNLTGSKK